MNVTGDGGSASGAGLDSGTVGGWPLRTGKVRWRPPWAAGRGGEGRGGGFHSCDHAIRVPAVLLVHVSGGASDSVLFRVPDVPVVCRACIVKVVDVPVNRSDKLQ